MARAGYSTIPGYTNRNGQQVERRTDLAGNLWNQRIYELCCKNCGAKYGANGCDVHIRKCPECQAGQAGLSLS
jgi:hypothetical protein